MARVWDLYLDASDAARLLDAVAVLERHRAVREPLPLHDAAMLLARLRTIAGVAEEDAVRWRREAQDRQEAARADGGRWGSPTVAATMVGTASDLADGAGVVAASAYDAAADLAARLDDQASRRSGASTSDADVLDMRAALDVLDLDPRSEP